MPAELTVPLEVAFEHAPAFVALTQGPDHVMAYANTAYVRLTGGRDVLGRSLRDAFPELEGQGLLELLDGVYATGKPFHGHSVPVTFDRSGSGTLEQAFFDFVYQPLPDAEGSTNGVLIHGVEVTEQVLAREELNAANEELQAANEELQSQAEELQSQAEELQAQSEELARHNATVEQAVVARTQELTHERGFLASVLDTLTDAMVACDAHGTVTHLNGAMARLFAFSDASPDSWHQHVQRLYLPDAQVPLQEQERPLVRLLRGETLENEQFVIRLEDEQFRIVQASGRQICATDGTLVGAVAVFDDVTSQVEADAFRRRQERHAALRIDVGDAMVGAGTSRQLLQRCTEAMVAHLDAAFARVWVVDDAGTTLELEASAGMYTHIDGGHARVPVGKFKIGLIAQEAAPHLTNDVQHDPRVGDLEWARREGLLAFAGYPLTVDGEVVGVMAMFARHALPKDTLDALAGVADGIAQGVQRKRAEERLQLINEELTAQAEELATNNEELTAQAEELAAQTEEIQRAYGDLASHGQLLAEQRRFAEALVDNQAGAFAYLDQDLIFRKVNATYASLFRRTASDFIGRYLFDVFQGTERQVAEIFQSVLQTAQPWSGSSFPFVYEDEQGTQQTYWDVSIAPLMGDAGRPAGMIVNAFEVSERVRADEALRQSEERFRVIFNQAAVGMAVLDRSGRVASWNPALESMLGVSPSEAGGGGFPAVTHPDDQAVEARLFDELRVERRESFQLEKRIVCPSGLEFWAAVVVTRVRDMPGQDTFAILTMQDISARIEAVRAREANRLKSEFLANMSHELRTPLNSIIGYTELVGASKRVQLDERSRANLDVVLRNARHLLSLINDILDLSKVEAGKLAIYPELIQPARLFASVQATMEPLAREKGLSIEVALDPALEEVMTDETKLRQVVLNLVSNAIKFTPTGKVEVRAETRGQGRWAVIVRDTGIGIAPEHHGMIFDEFRQVDGSATRTAGGTGLGLAIARKLARHLGGDLSLESALGQGSTFTIDLPRWLAPPPPEVTNADGEDRLTIVSIDDDPQALQLLSQALQDTRFRVIGAGSGTEGLRLIQEVKPFAVTLDIVMPRPDGWSVLRELKRDPVTAQIPVIILSFVDDRMRGFTLGAKACLAKPIDRAELVATLGALEAEFSRQGGYLLVVDDDPDARSMYRQMLEPLGVRVEEAVDGEAAIALMEQELPYLVVLDLMMPRMDGFAVGAWLRSRPETKDIPVVVVTAKDLEPNERARLAEVSKIVPKRGLVEDRLLDDIRSLLDSELRRSDGAST